MGTGAATSAMPPGASTSSSPRATPLPTGTPSHTGPAASTGRLRGAPQHPQTPLTSITQPGPHLTQPPDTRDHGQQAINSDNRRIPPRPIHLRMQSGLLLEHTFRLFKQVLGWTTPKIRNPEAADRWTWIIITCHTQLRLARPLAADLRLPWERPAPPGRLTPARVRRGFRNIRATIPCPAGAPKPGKPGPGRPPGSKNRRPATRYDVGKTTRRKVALKARRERAG